MRRALAIAAAGAAAAVAVACRPSEPARVTEKPLPLAGAGACRDSHLLFLDPDACRWTRVDGASGETEVLVEDTRYCSAYDISVHPREPRLSAHLYPEDDRHPDVLREVSLGEGTLRTIAVPRGLYVEYSGYDEHGRLLILVSDELPEPSRAVKVVYQIVERPTCALGRARALAFDGEKWVEVDREIAADCGDGPPIENLHPRHLAPFTMPGTEPLVILPKVTDPALRARLESALEAQARDEAPVWREKVTPWGRIARGGKDYGTSFWLVFLDPDGNVLGTPVEDDNTRMRLRGAFLLTTSEGEENARLYDTRTGRRVWEATSYASTTFFPCPW